MICPICEAENPQGAKYCGLCLHHLGGTYSKGLVDPPDWYSASDYKMVYSESTYLSDRLRAKLRKSKISDVPKKTNNAHLQRLNDYGNEESSKNSWF